MAEIVNLNKARKAKAKVADRATAAANRALHGVSKEARAIARAEREKAARLHEQTRRDPPPS